MPATTPKKHGHLKHSSYHNAWRRLKADYPWLDTYFCFDNDHSIRPSWRIRPALPATRAMSQIKAFHAQMPDYVLLIKWGAEYVLVAKTDTGVASMRVNRLAVKRIIRSLLSTGVTVALIWQSTARTTRIYDRYIHSVYKSNAVTYEHLAFPPEKELSQLRLLQSIANAKILNPKGRYYNKTGTKRAKETKITVLSGV